MHSPTNEDLEEHARELHRQKCHVHAIWDEEKIAEYWDGCNRDMYRRKAARANSGDVR
jgi:hypothetical protein